jgi:acetyl-CoA synthetase
LCVFSALHRIGTAEVESALVAHPKCAEAAVVGYEHPIKGQGIYAYVTLMEGAEYSEDLRRELINQVRGIIGAFAAPDVIHWVSCLDTKAGEEGGRDMVGTFVERLHGGYVAA